MSKFSVYFLFQIGALFLSAGCAFAQYGNEWIDFGKQYYKVTLASDGAFRLTYSDLQASGFPVNTIDPRRIQLYHRGVEQAIIVQGQADAVFNTTDYIEFYGIENDGASDAKLYNPSNLQPHSYYNLYSDSSAYFLTWAQGLNQGKRMALFSEVNVPPIVKETFHHNEKLEVYKNEYSGGNTISNVIQYTQFDQGEGWTGATICIGNSGCTGQQDFAINNLTGPVVSGGVPEIELLLVGRDALNHLAEVYVGPNSGSLRLLSTESFINFETRKINQPLLWSDISAMGQLVVRVKALGVGGQRDRLSVSYINVEHPQDFDMASASSKTFKLDEKPSDRSYVEINNPVSGISIWDITDRNNILIIGTTPSGGAASLVVQGTSVQRTLFAKNGFMTPKIEPVKFRQLNAALSNFIIISNRLLMQPALGYIDPVRAYGSFRASAEGGSYDTLVVSIDQLYNQFNYGEPSAVAIYQFMKFMVDNGDPKYLFLIGKGLNVSQGFFRKTTIGPNDFRDLVPSAGMPGSDMAFTAGLSGIPNVPAVATGRITASTSVQVASYLNKIKETESLPFNVLWRKNVLHLSGGIQPNELVTFKQYMDGFAEVAKGPYYGGEVKTIAKQEPNPVKLINISDEINDGLNFVTFFGHSSPSVIDIDIGFATDPILGYNNKGRYPTFLINGCNAGVFFSNGTVFGEDWILATDKGARNFIAHSSFGFSSTLRAYSQMFYEVGYGDSTFIRTGIGDIQKEVAERYLQVNSPSISSITQIQQMVLLGDPAVKLFGALKPDFETNDDDILVESFDGSPVTALTDSFAIKAITRNFGSVTKDSLEVRVTRTFNDNSTIVYDSIFYTVKSLDTLSIVIYKEEGASGFGNNTFLVELDYAEKIDELDELNNTGSLSMFIPLTGTKNLFPINNGIVDDKSLRFIWQNTDLLSETRNYALEVDTVDSFNSNFLKSQTLSGKVLLTFDFELLNQDSLVYYWRTKLSDPQPGENEGWATTSFVYINNGGEGWGQIHFPQFHENKTIGLMQDPALELFDFQETSVDVMVSTFGSSHPAPSATSFKINNSEYNLAAQGKPCRANTINLVAFNKTTLVPYAGIPFIFQDPRTCGRTPQVINSFTLSEMDLGGTDDLLEYIDNINTSDSVVIFSIGDAGYSSWTGPVITKLEELGVGSTQLSSLITGEPVVIFGRKGVASGLATIYKSPDTPAAEQELQVSKSLTGKFTEGSMSSTLIGPAESWESFISFIRDNEGSDFHSFDIYGVELLGTEKLLYSDVNGSLDISDVDPIVYPFIRMVLKTKDEINLSPIQLHQWIIKYTPVAEGILLFKGDRNFVSVQEGESWTASYSYRNISEKLFPDSLQVKFNTFNKLERLAENITLKIRAPQPGDSSKFSFEVKTRGKVGPNDVNVFVNPKVLPEQYYENNVLELLNYLNVEQDRIVPVLDVTFDGRYLLDGDFVSADPNIRINIWDESRFVLKKDTVGIRILLKYPCDNSNCDFVPIYFDREDVGWTPASDTSDFHLFFNPVDLTEGEYTLSVEVEDGSGNSSTAPYNVKFKVSDDNLARFDNPYPNPSNGLVYFNFTSTGSTKPSQYTLQVVNLSGKVVYEFIVNDGSLRIGLNQFTWGGTSGEGIQLNQGLYFYRQTLSVGDRQSRKNGKISLVR